MRRLQLLAQMLMLMLMESITDMDTPAPTDMEDTTTERGQLMKRLQLLAQMLMLMLMDSMDTDMDTPAPTDMEDTTTERGQQMRRLLLPDPTLMLMLMEAITDTDTPIPTDMEDTTMERDQRMLSPRLWPLLTLRLMLTPGGDITDTPMAGIMAMVTIPMATTGAESNQFKTKTSQQWTRSIKS